MLLLQALQELPVYKDFTVTTVFNIPSINYTVRYLGINQQSKDRQYYGFYNEQMTEILDDFMTDLSIGKQQYQFIQIDTRNCTLSEANEESWVSFLPDLTNFTQMEDTYLDLQRVQHYRLQDTYSVNVTNATFLVNQTYQQDYFCRMQNMNGQSVCLPFRWEIYGRSNFYSHQDVYILTFQDFKLTVDEQVFVQNDTCIDNTYPFSLQKRQFTPLSNFNKESQNILENLKKIDLFSKRQNMTYTVAPNKFIRYSRKQFEHKFLNKVSRSAQQIAKSESLPPPPLDECTFTYEPSELPKELDLRTILNLKVYDQAIYGLCYAFASAECLASRTQMAHLRQHNGSYEESSQWPLMFSPQATSDCAWDQDPDENPFYYTQGINGGQPAFVMKWYQDQGKIATYDEYRFLGYQDYCDMSRFTYTHMKINKVCRVPQSVDDLKYALQSGSVAVTIAVPEDLTFYSGGVYNNPECQNEFQDLVHNVVADGYGINYINDSEGNIIEQQYLIVRNSWSTSTAESWGQDGYIYIELDDRNLCGILTDSDIADVEYVE